MKKIYIGLGNPGKEYQYNRHNVGFIMIDFLLKNEDLQLRSEDNNQKLDSIIYNVTFKDINCLFVKPQTFMNRSGQAVKKILDYYKYPVGDLAVVYDDLDIGLGDFKIHEGLGPRTHNGLLSIEEHLKTQNFTQIRIGVDNRPTENRVNGEAYVLQNFTAEEEKKLTDEVFPKVLQSFP